jgi:hypothetical protein
MTGIIELRVYTLKPGTREAFRRRFDEEVGPMLQRFGITVIAALPSLHDDRSFTLIRAFLSLAEREAQLVRFYDSEEWLTRHDEAVMAMIDQYDTCVIDADALDLAGDEQR